MKVSATHLRILLVAVNFGVGLGVPAYAAYRYHGATERKTLTTKIVDPKTLKYNENAGTSKGETQAQDRLRFSAQKFEPQPPPPLPPLPPDEPKTGEDQEEPAGPDDPLDPGKLAEEGWYYAEFVLRPSDPNKSLVILRKRPPPPGPPTQKVAPPSTRATIKTPASLTSQKRVVRPGAPQPKDQISFNVGLRRYTNEELDVDFFIERADAKRFVYWLPEKGAKTMYALEYKSESKYLAAAPDEKTLSPRDKTPEELAAEPAAKKSGIILRDSLDYEFDRETEYNILRESGKPVVPAEKESTGGLILPAKSEGEGTAVPGGNAPAEVKPPMPQPKPGSQPSIGPKRDMTKDEAKQLKDAIKGIPKDAQKQIIEGLRGVKTK